MIRINNRKMNMKKTVIFLGMLGCFVLPYNVSASETTTPNEITELANNSCRLYTSYSDGIPVQNGDKFYIEFEDGNSVLNNMVVDVSAAAETPLDIEMETGDYKITNISYVGYNNEINTQGYCVTTDFSVGENAINEIHLGIGETQAERINEEYRNTLFIQNGSIVYSSEREESALDTPIEESSSDIQEAQITSVDESAENTLNETSVSENENIDSMEKEKEPTTDKDNTESNDSKYFFTTSSLLLRNIPVFVIIVAIIVVLILKHRDDKKSEE